MEAKKIRPFGRLLLGMTAIGALLGFTAVWVLSLYRFAFQPVK